MSTAGVELNKNKANEITVIRNVDAEAEKDSNSKPDSEDCLKLWSSLQQQLDLSNKNDEKGLRKVGQQPAGWANKSAVNEVEAESKQPPEVQVLNLTIQTPGRPDNVVPIPFRPSTSKATLFTLKEGSKYRIIFNFVVSKSSVSGLKYVGDVWKKGFKVDHTKKMIGTFSPQEEPYVFELENGTTPSGIFARGSYSARAKFVDDDDGKSYLDTIYYFDIQKNWASSS